MSEPAAGGRIPDDGVAAGPPSEQMHPGALLSLLADEARLRILAAAVLGTGEEHAILAASNLAPPVARRALARLASEGLLVKDGAGQWQVSVDLLKDTARRASRLRRDLTAEDVGATPEQAVVLRGFLADGRLVSIPVARRKRRVILDWLAQQFEPGEGYPESAVNEMLKRFHTDYAALRRYLVDEEFLERRQGFYWRAGGTFELD